MQTCVTRRLALRYVVQLRLGVAMPLTGANLKVSCHDRIWQSDTLISSSLRERLIAGVSKLENVPDSEKDWCPRSNGQVLDLVHPSLHCEHDMY